MKKVIFSAALLPLVLLTSCDAIKDKLSVKFDVPYAQDVEVKGLPGNPTIPTTGTKLTLFSAAYATNSKEHLKNNNTSSELLQEAVLKELKLEMKAPTGQNFDLADSVWVYLSSNKRPGILAARKFGIPKNTTSFSLDLETFNAKDYFLDDSIYLRLDARVYKSLDSATVMNISGVVGATANPLEK